MLCGPADSSSAALDSARYFAQSFRFAHIRFSPPPHAPSVLGLIIKTAMK